MSAQARLHSSSTRSSSSSSKKQQYFGLALSHNFMRHFMSLRFICCSSLLGIRLCTDCTVYSVHICIYRFHYTDLVCLCTQSYTTNLYWTTRHIHSRLPLHLVSIRTRTSHLAHTHMNTQNMIHHVSLANLFNLHNRKSKWIEIRREKERNRNNSQSDCWFSFL